MATSDIKIVQEVKIKDLDKIIKELKGIRKALESLAVMKAGFSDFENIKNSLED